MTRSIQMDVIVSKQSNDFINASGYNQYKNRLLCSCALKDYLTFLEGVIYDDPERNKQKKEVWRMFKDAYNRIGME